MEFPSHLVSPSGVTVAVGSAREHVSLRSLGYKTPEQVTAAAEQVAAQAVMNVAAAESEVAVAAADSSAAQTDLDLSRDAAAADLAAANAELAQTGTDETPKAPGRTGRTK